MNLDGVADLDLGQLRFRAVADNVLQSVHLRFLLLFTDIHSHSIDGRGLSGFMYNPSGIGHERPLQAPTFITCLYMLPQRTL